MKYKAYEHADIREFYSLLRTTLIGARKAQLLLRLINDQTLPGIMARMPLGDWKQWAKERPQWIQGSLEYVFWKFVDQKWRDSLNLAAAEPSTTDYSLEFKKTADRPRKGETEKQFKKGPVAEVNVATLDVEEKETKTTPRAGERGPQKCKFSEITGCTGSHPPWLCKAFGDKTLKKEAKPLKTTSCACSACSIMPRRCVI